METLAFGYGLIEGPRVDSEGGLYFSDVPKGGVYRRAPDGRIDTVIPRRKGVGGIALHADGGIVVSGRDLCHVRDGRSRVLFTLAGVGGWNDLFTDAAGRVYAGTLRSDPFQAGERVPGELWRVEREGEAHELYGGVGVSNGIGFSPDGRRLYHSDSSGRCIVGHDVAPDGSVSKRCVFARLEQGFPDGLAVDAEGGVWCAVFGGGCVARFAADGRLDQTVSVPARSVTSLCFGGHDLCDLYVVSADNLEHEERRGTIFRTRSPVPGLPAPLATV